MNDDRHGERTESPEGDRQVRCPFDPIQTATIARRPDSDLVTLFAAWLGRPLGLSLPAWRLIDEVYSREADAEAQWRSLAEELRQGRLKGQERVGLFTLAKAFPADFKGVDDLLVPLMGEGRLDELGRSPEDTRRPEEIARDHETIAEMVLRNHKSPSARQGPLAVGKGTGRRWWVGLGDGLGVGPLGGGWVQGDAPGGAGGAARPDAEGDRGGEFDFATFARLGRELVATAKEHLGADDRGLIGRLVSAAPRYARAEIAGETAAAEPIANELGAVWHDINQANIPETVWWSIQGYQEPFEARFGKLDDFAVLPEGRPRAPLVPNPPHNSEVEQALLGAILVNNQAIEKVRGLLRPEHFTARLNGRIYEACGRLIDHGQSVTPVTLKGLFDQDEALRAAGGAAYLVRLAASAVANIDVEEFARKIYEDYLRRQQIDHGKSDDAPATDATWSYSSSARGSASASEASGSEISTLRTNLSTSCGAVERAITILEERRPNSEGEIARKEETLRRLRITLTKLKEADAILESGEPAEAAARPIAMSLLTLLKDLDKLDQTGPGVKIINTGLGIVVLCAAATFDSIVPGWAIAPVMATGVYGTTAVKTVMDTLKSFLRGSDDDGKGGSS